MKIVIASDSFKGTLSSLDIINLFKEELINSKDIEPIYLPLADGGEGSLDCIANIKKGKYIELEVNNLYFKKIKTKFYLDDELNAYIETASCAGLNLANKQNDPGKVTTFGLGEQIKEAIKLGSKNIYLFLGGSATNDAGCGLAYALGTKFFNKKDEEFCPVGLTLKDIVKIDNKETLKLLKDINIYALVDVKSPFYGKVGAAYKFAPQKGASIEEVKELDENLKYLSELINKDLKIDISNVEGAGAAGGLGGGLFSFLNANIESGINTILDLVNFNNLIKNTDLIISGEGKLDLQTLDGKVIDGIASRCNNNNKPLYLIVGISTINNSEIIEKYPCIKNIYETNFKHLPFDEIKDNAKKDYRKQIKNLLKDLSKKSNNI